MKRDVDPQASGFVHPRSSEITPRAVYESRRQWLRWVAGGAAGAALAGWAEREASAGTRRPGKLVALSTVSSTVPAATAADKVNDYQDITTYNNFYEFGTDKSEPAQRAGSLKTRPWKVSIEGEVAKPKVLSIDDLLKLKPLEERIYRLRCVEGWSMVIPWVGYSLSAIIDLVQPTSRAKYVQFVSLADREQMPGVADDVLAWPYVEGLRMDEARHPLTLLTLGLYGEVLPAQNGAPVRVVVPWKYGFKSAKSIVKIRFVEQQPATSWSTANPGEYGFYSNVNPQVDHPRWSQATERRIGDGGGFAGLFAPRRPTLMFNGYAAQVADLYRGMDLRKYF